MEDWIECTLGELINVFSGKGLISSAMSGKGYPVYGGNGITGFHSEYLYEEEKLIIGRVGVKCGVTHITKKKSWITDNALIVDLKQSFLNLKFLKLKLQFEDLNKLSNSTAQPVISGTKIYSYLVKIPPLPEQRAIVAKIEQLFSELDNGIDNLQKAQEQLKVYRKAVLKKAFEGELTKAWRAEQTGLPPAEELLKRITIEREADYQQQVEVWKLEVKEWESNRKVGKKPAKPKVLKELSPLTVEELAKLPKLAKEWAWCKIGDVTKCLDSQRVPINKVERLSRNGDIPYFGANGQVGWIDNYIFDDELVIVVEDETFTGRQIPFSYKITGKAWVNNHAHVLKNESFLNVDYLNYSLMYYPFIPLTTGSTGRRKLTQGALLNAPYSVAPLLEQHQIVQEIETRLSVCDKVEETIKESLEKAEALRQSILKKAFEGKLLTEVELEACRKERDWEPAEKLLERIKAEKGKAGKGKKKEVPA